MPKARNMIIDGYKKGTQLQIDKYGIFYIFNGRNPINNIYVESFQVLTEETSKNLTSTVGRGIIGSALFGNVGISASLTGKEDKIYTVKIFWDNEGEKIIREPSVLELDSEFYKMLTIKCTQQKALNNENKTNIKNQYKEIPPKYIYDYLKWINHNEIIDDGGVNQVYLEALDNNPETNPILDCCRSINPKWEEYMEQQEQSSQQQKTQPTINNTSDIKSKLQQLKSMYEEDLITEEEYNSKKQELLSKM